MHRNFTAHNPFPSEDEPWRGRAFAEQGGGGEGGEAGAPAEGGAESQGPGNPGLYDLSDAPEELKPWLQRELQRMESGVGSKIQEAAELRKKFEPLAGVEGLDQFAPDDLQELVQLGQILSDPEQATAWARQVAEQVVDEDTWAQMGETNGWFEGAEGGEEGEAAAQQSPELQAALAKIEELEGQFQQFTGTQEQEKSVAQAEEQLQGRMQELTSQVQGWDEGGDESDPNPDTNAVIELAHAFIEDDDPIGKAFERYMKISGKSEGQLLDGKLQQPGGALNGGQADTSPEAFGMDDPRLKETARQRFAQTR